MWALLACRRGQRAVPTSSGSSRPLHRGAPKTWQTFPSSPAPNLTYRKNPLASKTPSKRDAGSHPMTRLVSNTLRALGRTRADPRGQPGTGPPEHPQTPREMQRRQRVPKPPPLPAAHPSRWTFFFPQHYGLFPLLCPQIAKISPKQDLPSPPSYPGTARLPGSPLHNPAREILRGQTWVFL